MGENVSGIQIQEEGLPSMRAAFYKRSHLVENIYILLFHFSKAVFKAKNRIVLYDVLHLISRNCPPNFSMKGRNFKNLGTS